MEKRTTTKSEHPTFQWATKEKKEGADEPEPKLPQKRDLAWQPKGPSKQSRLDFETKNPKEPEPDEKEEEPTTSTTLPQGKSISTKSFPYKNFDCSIESCKEMIDKHGVAVVPCLSVVDVKKARDEMWALLEVMLAKSKTPFDRNKPETWNSFFDMMPMHGMLLQHFQVGQSQFSWNVRQSEKIAEAFAKLYGKEKEDMLTSFDGVSIHLPPEQTGKGFFRNNLWFHTDQSYCDSSFMCIQGMVTLWDVDEGDATLACWPGSHNIHASFGRKFKLDDSSHAPNKANWQKMGDDAVKWGFLESKGLSPTCVRAKAGSLILWDSRTMHQGIQSVKDRAIPKPRCVVYVCQLPRSGASEAELKKKREANENARTTSHWPYPVKLFAKKPRTYGQSIDHIVLPENAQLTPLGKLLAGYC